MKEISDRSMALLNELPEKKDMIESKSFSSPRLMNLFEVRINLLTCDFFLLLILVSSPDQMMATVSRISTFLAQGLNQALVFSQIEGILHCQLFHSQQLKLD